MKIPILIRIEFTKLITEFRLSLKQRYMLISYLIFTITLLLFSFGMYSFLFFASDIRQYLFIFSRDKIFVIILNGLFFFNIFKGLSIKNFSDMFNNSDIYILFSYPINPRELYISKYFRNAFKHFIIFSIIYFSIYPLFLYLQFNIINNIILFILIYLFIEISYILNHIVFFSIRTYIIHKINMKKNKNIYALSFISFMFLMFIYLFNYLHKNSYNILPTSILIISIINVISLKNFSFLYDLLKYLLLNYLILIIISYIIGNDYYEFIARANETHWVINLNLFNYAVPWNKLKNHTPLFILVLKDLWLHFRENGINFFASILFNYSFFIIFLFLKNFLDFLPFIKNIQKYSFLIFPFIIIFLLIISSPAINVFNKEAYNLWFLKSTIIPINNIIYGKFIYCLLISIILNLPIFILIIFSINNIIEKLIMLSIIIHTVFICNSIGILISVNNLFNYKDIIERSFISYFNQLVISFALISGYIHILLFNPFISYIVFILYLALYFTKYELPYKYYFIELISIIYLMNILYLLIFGGVIISNLYIYFINSKQNFINTYNFFIYLIITILSIILIVKSCLNLSIRTLLTREESI